VKTESGKMETVTVKTEMEDCDDPDEESDSTFENCPVEDMKIEVEEWSPTPDPDLGVATSSCAALRAYRIDRHTTRPEQEPEPSTSSAKPSDTGFTCAVCGQTFVTKGDLVKHLPIHSGVKPVACRRNRTHIGEKPHVCDVC